MSVAKLDTLLTIGFYVLALASIVSYLWLRAEYPQLFIYLGFGAVALRIVHYALRLISPKK